MTSVVLPLLVMIAVALAVSLAMLGMAKALGPRRRGAVKEMPYESGMDPIHDARRRFDVRFYMVAIAFLIFDVELLFLYPWAVARTSKQGLVSAVEQAATDADPTNLYRGGTSYVGDDFGADVAERLWIVFGGVMVFIAVLTLGFVYDWKKGLFQWR
jgi:NADH-quinone oxidoreductase subunit A